MTPVTLTFSSFFLISSSRSYVNSFEIAGYIAEAGQILTVKIRGASINKDAWTYFGIEWTTF